MSGKITLPPVTDLPRREVLLHALQEAVVRHQPAIVALVGDFLHAFDDNEGRVRVYALRISSRSVL